MNQLLLTLVMVLLGSCQSRINDKPPPLELPSDWGRQSLAMQGSKKDSRAEWWTKFHDSVLENMIEEAFRANSDMLIAMSNVSKAKAQVMSEEANKFPNIGLQGSAKQTKTNSPKKTTNSFSLATVLNYEVDLWGVVANNNKAATALLLSSVYNQGAVKLKLASDVAVAYFNLLALNKQLSVTQRMIASQEEIYQLTSKLFELGAGDAELLSQAESDLITTKTYLPSLQQSLSEQEKALAVLLGKSPSKIVSEVLNKNKHINDLPITIIIPKTLPSELLEQRPDIKAAEQNLIAVNAQIAAIKASCFPSISLTGLLGLSSTRMSKLFKNSAVNSSTGASLTSPLIDFGQIKANIIIAEETKKQYIIQYQQTVRVAFEEVINALSDQENSAINFKLTEQNQQALTKIRDLTQQRYNNGTSSYLDVLNAQQTVLKAEINTINSRLNCLVASVNLFHALGGGW